MIIDIAKLQNIGHIRELEPYALSGKLGKWEVLRYLAAWGAYFERHDASEPYLAWGNPIVYLYPKFVHTAALFTDPRAAAVIADQLVNRLPHKSKPDCVAGPGHGAWGLVAALAQRWGGIRQQLTKRTNVRKEQLWVGPALPPGGTVQLCDDLVRGGETLEQLADAVLAANSDKVEISPEVLTVVNVSGQEQIGRFQVISLVSFRDERLLPRDHLGESSRVVRSIEPYLYEKPAEEL